jgi:hypothetical protein
MAVVERRGSFSISLRPPPGETSSMLGCEEYFGRRRRNIAMVPDWECNIVHKCKYGYSKPLPLRSRSAPPYVKRLPHFGMMYRYQVEFLPR